MKQDRASAVPLRSAAAGAPEPLTSHEVVIETIRATTTKTGLSVKAEPDLGVYQKGIKISDEQIEELQAGQLPRHDGHKDWNDTIHPATSPNASR